MKLKHTAFACIAASLLALAGCSHSHAGWFDRGEYKRIKHISYKLDLSEEQKDQLAEVFDIMQESRPNKRDSYSNEAREFWSQSQISADDIASFHAERIQNMAAMATPDARVSQALADFHAGLTAEQREEFAKLMAKGRGFVMLGGKRGYYGRGWGGYHHYDHDDHDHDDD